MIVTINQPNYLPTLHFFEQIYRSDIFIFYDDVQYTRGDWRNRNRIKTQNGWQWLTVPITNKLKQKINEAKIDNNRNWVSKHLKTIEANYSKTPYFDIYWEEFKNIYKKKYDYLLDLDISIISTLCKILELDHRFELSSNLNIKGEKTQRLVDICRHFNADIYYSPKKSKQYLDIRQFEEYGIKVEFQDYIHPIYDQLYNRFIPYLSIIDLLFNCGQKSLSILIGECNE